MPVVKLALHSLRIAACWRTGGCSLAKMAGRPLKGGRLAGHVGLKLTTLHYVRVGFMQGKSRDVLCGVKKEAERLQSALARPTRLRALH
jgi:hypothetical protein